MGGDQRFVPPSGSEVLRRRGIPCGLCDRHRVARRLEAPARQTLLPGVARGESRSDLQIGLRIREQSVPGIREAVLGVERRGHQTSLVG